MGSEGQDGRLLFERLASGGCAVLGIGRLASRASDQSIVEPFDIHDCDSVARAVDRWKPDAVFYLAAFHQSSQQPVPAKDLALLEKSFRVNVTGAANFLEALRRHPRCAFFYAASSMVFGEPSSAAQDESTPLDPGSVYGISKAAGMHLCRMYRREHGVMASAGILFNHESPLRNDSFVSRKIARAVAAIAAGGQEKLTIGDLSARTDWGYAPDYVEAMIRIVECDMPDDYVIATGESHTVQEFVELAFARVGLRWQDHVVENPAVLQRRRPTLCGNSSKLRERTGWEPKTSFNDMVAILVDAALAEQ